MDMNSYNIGRAAAHRDGVAQARYDSMSSEEKSVYRFVRTFIYVAVCAIASFFLFESPSTTFPNAQYFLAVPPIFFSVWCVFKMVKNIFKLFK